MRLRRALALLLTLAAVGAAPHRDGPSSRAVASFALPAVPFLPGSIVPLDLNGLEAPYDVELLGEGRITASQYDVPNDVSGSATLIASNATAVAERTIRFATPPDAATPFIAVASYDEGVVLHDARAPFAQRSIFAVGGAPADVAVDADGLLGAAATDGTTAAIASLRPWTVRRVDGVPFADESAFDPATHALFFTDRESNGAGAITRVAADGTVRTRTLGLTSEGIAIDARRRRAYVANTNDGTISIVDLDSLVELQRFNAVPRVFSLALDAAGSRLYAVSNQSYTSPFGAAGSAVAIDVAAKMPHVVARSAPLAFPVGIAVDDEHHRVFVTDERDDDIYVLAPQHLRPLHAPVQTCRTPWKPLVDRGLLYVPCARDDKVDVIDTSTLRREAGAPFATGGYPLAVAVWHPPAAVKR